MLDRRAVEIRLIADPRHSKRRHRFDALQREVCRHRLRMRTSRILAADGQCLCHRASGRRDTARPDVRQRAEYLRNRRGDVGIRGGFESTNPRRKSGPAAAQKL